MKAIEEIKEHDKVIQDMLKTALKQYGGLGGLKNIESVLIPGKVFWNIVNTFDAGDLLKALPIKKVVKPKASKKKSETNRKPPKKKAVKK